MSVPPSQTPGVKQGLPLWLKGASMILLLGFLVFLGLALQKSNIKPLRIGDEVQNFSFTTFDGKSMSLNDLRGKTVLINIWASWCVECSVESEALQTVWQEAAQGNDVVFLGVDYADSETEALAFIKEFSITYLNGPDLGSKIYRQFHATGVPETYLIDKDGRLMGIKIGPFASADEIRVMLSQ